MLGYLSSEVICFENRIENCELREDNAQGQISEHFFAPNGGFCFQYPSNLFHNMRSFENWEIISVE